MLFFFYFQIEYNPFFITKQLYSVDHLEQKSMLSRGSGVKILVWMSPAVFLFSILSGAQSQAEQTLSYLQFQTCNLPVYLSLLFLFCVPLRQSYT